MEHGVFIVRHDGKYHGPFLRDESGLFASRLEGPSEVVPLYVPTLSEDRNGPTGVWSVRSIDYRTYVDQFKVDTSQFLAGVIQSLYSVRREQRVLTAQEIKEVWGGLYRVNFAVASLMHYADRTVAEPCANNLDALRLAIWRNRDSDDVDPHYADRFW